MIMPYKIVKGTKGYYVINKETNKRKNKKPLTKIQALKYMKALYVNSKE